MLVASGLPEGGAVFSSFSLVIGNETFMGGIPSGAVLGFAIEVVVVLDTPSTWSVLYEWLREKEGRSADYYGGESREVPWGSPCFVR